MHETALAPPTTCTNCGALLHGPFCAACGQEVRPLNPTLREVVGEVAQEMVSWDNRILRSVWALFRWPGFLTREQFEGRRVAWLTPIRLYLAFSVLYFAVAAVAGTNLRIGITGDTDAESIAAIQRLGFKDESELRSAVHQMQAVWRPRVMFVLVPVFAWLVGRVRRRSGRTFPQHVQFALHAHAAWFGVRALAAAGKLAEPTYVGGGLEALGNIYGIVYVILALRTAYGIPTRRAIRDGLILLAIYFLVVIVATLGLVAFAIFGPH